MNLLNTLFFVAVVVALVWLGFWLRRKAAKATEGSEWYDERKILRITSWVVWAIALVVLLGTLQSHRIINIKTPFSGPTVGNTLPRRTEVPEAGEPPKVEVKDGRPDLDKVKADHQEKLNDFEEK